MSSTKQIAREAFHTTLSSIDICATVRRKLHLERSRLVLSSGCIDLRGISRIIFIAIGKAAHAMAQGVISLFPEGTSVEGVVAAPTPPAAPVRGLQYFVGGHPLPNGDSMACRAGRT